MTNAIVETLPLAVNQSITVSYSRHAKLWWAVLWQGDKVIESADGASPIEALGTLILLRGWGVKS